MRSVLLTLLLRGADRDVAHHAPGTAGAGVPVVHARERLRHLGVWSNTRGLHLNWGTRPDGQWLQARYKAVRQNSVQTAMIERPFTCLPSKCDAAAESPLHASTLANSRSTMSW